ncbi:MAG TPA: hypothetical protein VG268_10685 [Streptosporangiaceae bacterium]|nr:hypothetical protein [Streptosporangiaceae bacterium]
MGRTVALDAATAAWVLWWVTLHPDWHRRAVPMTVYFAGFVVCAACSWPGARGTASSAGSATCTRSAICKER